MARSYLKFDLKRLSELKKQLPKEASEVVGRLTDQLSGYETRVRGLVKELDSKSKEARDMSRDRLEQMSKSFKKTRVEVEKRVIDLVNEERDRLQARANDLVDYLRRVAKVEGTLAKKPAKKSTARKTKKAAAHKKPRAKRVLKVSEASAGLSPA